MERDHLRLSGFFFSWLVTKTDIWIRTLVIAASSIAAWNGPRDRLTAAIYKAVISSSLTLFDSNPCCKTKWHCKRVRLLVRKIRLRVRVGNRLQTANGLLYSLQRARGVKVKFWDFAAVSPESPLNLNPFYSFLDKVTAAGSITTTSSGWPCNLSQDRKSVV